MQNLVARWLLPPGVQDAIRGPARLLHPAAHRLARLCAANVKYRNRHLGRRCFIVCSGPSVKEQNLLPLKEEITLFVSTGFLHPDYSTIQPTYHCTPGDAEQGSRFVKWYKRIDESIEDTELFLNGADEPFIRKNGLFPKRPVNYLNMSLPWDRDRTEIYDLAARIPWVQSVPVMAILIAMYMGCAQIYLLGVDVDEIWTREYKHYYDDEILRNHNAVSEDGRVTMPLVELFTIYQQLWQQFTDLKRIADANGVEIINATAGGALDVYPRAHFEDLFADRTSAIAASHRSKLQFGTGR